MHSARLSKSARLRRVRDLLSDGKTYSTREIIQKAEVCAVNSIIAELRENGIDINCRRVGAVWWYNINEKEHNNGKRN